MADRIRSMSLHELMTWFSDEKCAMLDEANYREICDLWALLKELDISSGLQKHCRGMVLFKISAIIDLQSKPIRFSGSDSYNPWKHNHLEAMQKLPRLLVELHSWVVGHDIRGDAGGNDYIVSKKNVGRLTNILAQLTAYLENRQSPSTNYITTKVFPAEDLIEASAHSTAHGENATAHETSLPVQIWLEGLYSLALRISNDLLNASDDDQRKALTEALQRVDDILCAHSLQHFCAQFSHTQRPQVDFSKSTETNKLWADSSHCLVKTEVVDTQTNFREFLSSGILDYRTQNMIYPPCTEQNASHSTPGTVKDIILQSADKYLSLVQSDFEYLEPELWRIRSSSGFFQAFRCVMSLARYDAEILSRVSSECPTLKHAVCSYNGLEKILRFVMKRRGILMTE